MSTSYTKVALVTGALVAATLVAGNLVLSIVSIAFAAGFGESPADMVGNNLPLFSAALLGALFRFVLFGLGVFVSLRFVARIEAGDAWRRVIVRGLIAAAIGAAVLVVVGSIESVFRAASLGGHPFGYSLDPSVNTDNLGRGIAGSVLSATTPFVDWLPLVILAGILLKVWLERHPEVTPTPAVARTSSGAAKP